MSGEMPKIMSCILCPLFVSLATMKGLHTAIESLDRVSNLPFQKDHGSKEIVLNIRENTARAVYQVKNNTLACTLKWVRAHRTGLFNNTTSSGIIHLKNTFWII